MLKPNLNAIARELLEVNSWNWQKALPELVKRLDADRFLRGPIIHEAALSVLRSEASRQRTKLHVSARRPPKADDASGLDVILNDGFLDTYLLPNRVRLRDALKSDVLEAIQLHDGQAARSTSEADFLRRLVRARKWRDGAKLGQCLSEADVVRIAGEFKC